jgi:hypothetical protein
MPATGPEFTRRALLFASFAFSLRADSADEVWELLSSLASGLSAGQSEEFMRAFDPAMPGYANLRADVTALVGQAEVQSSIELVGNEGNDRSRVVEVDWLMRITGRDEVSSRANRQERVKCNFERQGKRWRIVQIEPRALFAPPRPK